MTISESFTPLGNGKFIKEVAKAVDSWPELNGTKYDENLDISINFTEQVIPSTTEENGKGIDVEPIDKWRSKKELLMLML